jgi:hypothetical protein
MPTAGAMLQEAIRVLRFDIVGFGGFLIDAAILALMTDTMNANPFAARAVSVPVAIAFTFVSNRPWSFASARRQAISRSFFRVRFHPERGPCLQLKCLFGGASRWPALSWRSGRNDSDLSRRQALDFQSCRGAEARKRVLQSHILKGRSTLSRHRTSAIATCLALLWQIHSRRCFFAYLSSAIARLFLPTRTRKLSQELRRSSV